MMHLLFADPDRNWTHDAICASVDPELFFPERGQTSLPAKRICAGCPVRLPCLTEGLQEEEGVWGGANPDDRARLRAEIYKHPQRRTEILAHAAHTITPSPSSHLNRRNHA